jgi:hypothetical protein
VIAELDAFSPQSCAAGPRQRDRDQVDASGAQLATRSRGTVANISELDVLALDRAARGAAAVPVAAPGPVAAQPGSPSRRR